VSDKLHPAAMRARKRALRSAGDVKYILEKAIHDAIEDHLKSEIGLCERHSGNADGKLDSACPMCGADSLRAMWNLLVDEAHLPERVGLGVTVADVRDGIRKHCLKSEGWVELREAAKKLSCWCNTCDLCIEHENRILAALERVRGESDG